MYAFRVPIANRVFTLLVPAGTIHTGKYRHLLTCHSDADCQLQNFTENKPSAYGDKPRAAKLSPVAMGIKSGDRIVLPPRRSPHLACPIRYNMFTSIRICPDGCVSTAAAGAARCGRYRVTVLLGCDRVDNMNARSFNTYFGVHRIAPNHDLVQREHEGYQRVTLMPENVLKPAALIL